MVHAEKAFFAARVMRWIRNKVKTEPDFNLQAYLTMLLYYKTDMADLKFDEEEDTLLYKLKNPDDEVQNIVDQLIKNIGKSASKPPEEGEDTTSTTEDADGTPDSKNIKSYFAAKDYKFFDTPDRKLNLNIIGVRRDNQGSNTFDDFLLVMYREEELMVSHRWQATTDPGKYWLMNPMNPKGTAVLAPWQYRSTWQLGNHQGKYEALVQRKPVKVYRDNNKDETIDYNNITTLIDEGYFGINIHRSNPYDQSYVVNKWSTPVVRCLKRLKIIISL